CAGDGGCVQSAKGIPHHVAGVRGPFDQAADQGKWLLVQMRRFPVPLDSFFSAYRSFPPHVRYPKWAIKFRSYPVPCVRVIPVWIPAERGEIKVWFSFGITVLIGVLSDLRHHISRREIPLVVGGEI